MAKEKITTIILAIDNDNKIWPYNYKGKMRNSICGNNLVQQAVINSKVISNDIHIIYNDINASSIKNFIDKKNVFLHKTETDSEIEAIQKWLKNNKTDNDFLIYDASTFIATSFDMKKFITNKDVSLLIKKSKDKAILQTGLSFNSQNNKIFLNPRSHYVDSKIANVYFIKNKFIKFLEHGNSDFINLSIGVPPSNKLLIANSINMILEKGTSANVIKSKNWENIILPWDIAKSFFIEMKEKESISNKATIEKGANIGKNCFIEEGAFIDKRSTIGDNCYIGKDVKVTDGAIIRDNTHLGEGTKIGFHADIEGFLMENISIVHYSEINAMIGRGSEIGAGTFVGALKFNDKNPLFKVQKLRFTGETIYPCFIGNYVRTGVGTLTLPGVIIGNESAISPGAIVKENIDDNILLIVKQKNKSKKIKWGFDKFGGN